MYFPKFSTHTAVSSSQEAFLSQESLPNTGIKVFDTRRDKTWKSELKEYLAQKKDYTGEIFDYDRLWNCIEKIATQFVQDISK